MITWGVTALSHDASLAVVRDGELVFAAHSERYSRQKNDARLARGLLAEACTYGVPDRIGWYERVWLKKLRQAYAGQWSDALTLKDTPRQYLATLGLPFKPPDVTIFGHHESHALTGVLTSGYVDAAVMVADAIGEFDTFSIAQYHQGEHLASLHRTRYPHSLGLLYSAFTRRCGFRPNEDEYIVMGMAALGEPRYVDAIKRSFIELDPPGFRLRANVHRGIGDWMPGARREDLAASVQAVTEEVLLAAARWARGKTCSANLVLMGGVALNCVANSLIAREAGFDRVWIFPNPGDAGSSVGVAVALADRPVPWSGPYLGSDIDRELTVAAIVDVLRGDGLVGVANGRAEFGPRALGNRSILADPRPADMKDRVNRIKGRERFRPFAPVIRAERAAYFFDMPVYSSPYMQFTAACREPAAFPAVCHFDGTSRVQTVTRDEHPTLYDILTAWESATGCPMLLNTSLNSRGEPLVNDWGDAVRFSEREGLLVL